MTLELTARDLDTTVLDAAGNGTKYSAVPSGVATLTGSVTISGSPVVNEILTANDTLDRSPATLGTISYQWYLGAGTGTPLVTTQNKTVLVGEIGSGLWCRESGTDSMGNAWSSDSALTANVTAAISYIPANMMSFEDFADDAFPSGHSGFNDEYVSGTSFTRAVVTPVSVGNRAVKFECKTGAEGAGGQWGAKHLFVSSTGINYQSNDVAGYGIGETVIALDVGTGTVVVNSNVTFTGDPNLYLVTVGLSGGNITIGGTGLKQTLANDVVMTVQNKRPVYGETLRCKYDSYIPANYEFLTGAGHLKTLRFGMHDSGDNALGTVEFAEKPDGTWRAISELFADTQHESSGSTRTRDVYESLELEVYMHDTAGSIRVWHKDILIIEALNLVTAEVGGYCGAIYFHTNWNNGAPMILENVANGTPAVDDQISSDGVAGANFAYIGIDYGSNKYAIKNAIPLSPWPYQSSSYNLVAGDQITDGTWTADLVETSMINYIDNIVVTVNSPVPYTDAASNPYISSAEVAV